MHYGTVSTRYGGHSTNCEPSSGLHATIASGRVGPGEIERDVCQWDIATWAQALRFWEQKVNLNQHHRCLEVGALRGGLSLWLALKGCDVLCSDLRDTERRAAPLHRKYHVNVAYQDINVEAIPYEAAFDIIVFKSMLGALNDEERQRKAVSAMFKALKPGGALLFAENLLASKLHQALRRRFRPHVATWRYVTIKDMNSFLHMFSGVQFRTAGMFAAFGIAESQRRALALIDRAVVPVCPSSWRYLMFGVAWK